MPFLDFNHMELRDFRPGIQSAAHFGEQMTLAVMSIDEGQADSGHLHPFEQCGVVLAGSFSLTIGEVTRILGPGQGYFIPAGVPHGWSTEKGPVKILDLSARFPAPA